MEKTEQTFSADELATKGSQSRHSIYRAIRSGTLPAHYEPGSSVPRVKQSDWQAFNAK